MLRSCHPNAPCKILEPPLHVGGPYLVRGLYIHPWTVGDSGFFLHPSSRQCMPGWAARAAMVLPWEASKQQQSRASV